MLWVDEWTAETDPRVVRARARGEDVRHPAQRLLDDAAVPVVAITGTAGKTTAAHVLAAILRSGGVGALMSDTAPAANAWPQPDVLDAPAPADAWLVAELTSTHLCYLELRDTPRVSVVTCLWPDHVELHGGLEGYIAAKRRILEGQPPDGWAVRNADDTWGLHRLGAPRCRSAWFSAGTPVDRGVWLRDGELMARWGGPARAVCAASRMPAWAHPVPVLAACAAALACGVEGDDLAAGLDAVPALPHRRTPLRSGDVRVVDDAMAATPGKARATLAAHPDGSVVLLAGGDDRLGGAAVHGGPEERALLEAACREAARAARLVVTFGPAARRITPLLSGVAVMHAPDLATATRVGLSRVTGDEVLLLCPMFPVTQAERAAFATWISRA